jgi:NAD(P)-dependent dehydrogenase (short-subunit alcohol dehydrogenase family)
MNTQHKPVQTAVVTGAASGLGLEFARAAAARGMQLVLTDIQPQALEAVGRELSQHTAVVLRAGDVSQASFVEALKDATVERFGAPHLLFNNAGVGAGGFIWEHSANDWQWVLGVNLMGVAHGVRAFTPVMLKAAAADASFRACIVNTASMAGMLNAPNMGAYNVSKHAVVSLTETLYQDLSLVTSQVRCAVLCPYFIPTDIYQSHKHRPTALENTSKPTASQRVAQALAQKAVTASQVTAADFARMTFDAIDAGRFYVFSHDFCQKLIRQRFSDIDQLQNPSDPFASQPAIREAIQSAAQS